MDVMTAINKTIEYSIRITFLFYGISDLIGVLWFFNTLDSFKIVIGIMLGLSELCIGAISVRLFIENNALKAYVIICLVGSILSMQAAVEFLMKDYINWRVINIRFLLSLFFAVLLYNGIKTRNQ